ncbi:MAG: AI-2E family transporter [Gammaproteobacteria bacterium]|nr:AI-2E family transporter [Gammaproteobacteria bacterium]
MNNLHNNRSVIPVIAPSVLLIILIWLGYEILQGFLAIIAWALIVTYIMWPMYEWIQVKLRHDAVLSASVMTGIIAVTLLFGFYWLANVLQQEVATVYQSLTINHMRLPTEVPDNIKNIPWLGHYLQQYLDQIHANQDGARAKLLALGRQGLGEMGELAGNIGKNIIQLGLIIVALFFFFRDGQNALSQLRRALRIFIGDDYKNYLETVGNTTQAVVYGLVLAALGQGLIAGIGYAIASVNAPVLLGVLTALFALVPMGATLIWLPVGLGLMLTENYWQGIGLLLWGVLAISTVDNIIRPLVISGAGHIPFLVVLFGVFGGLTAFGAIGLFIGPVILSILLTVWRTFLLQNQNK